MVTSFLYQKPILKSPPRENRVPFRLRKDCTVCKLCVEICPVKSKTEVKRKALNVASLHCGNPRWRTGIFF
jgi:formate hydrogenlyase subunit 6/NADH:ubiquinone oxidoreductase subunit I